MTASVGFRGSERGGGKEGRRKGEAGRGRGASDLEQLPLANTFGHGPFNIARATTVSICGLSLFLLTLLCV